MLEWGSPFWLTAAAVTIPVVWWLHRFHRLEAPWNISAVFLWRSQADDASPGSRARKADPSWLLRALTMVCLCLAAGQPAWLGSAQDTIEVWFDDSLSMQTLEAGEPRAHLATRSLAEALASKNPRRVIVHSLGRPGKRLVLEEPGNREWVRVLADWVRRESDEPDVPLPVQMNRMAEHWLVSDGAHSSLAPWVKKAPIARTIQVGAQTENVAITRIALRRSLRDPNAVVGIVKVVNVGRRSARRELTIRAGNEALLTAGLTMAPGEVIQRQFEVGAHGKQTLQAVILPNDALREDDEIRIDLGAIGPVAIALRGRCGRHLQAALLAHPAVRLVSEDTQEAQASVACGTEAPSDTIPVLWIRPSQDSKVVKAPVVWRAGAGPLRELVLSPEWLRHSSAPMDEARFVPLLLAGDVPLIVVAQAPRRRVGVTLDLESPNLVRRPEYAALVAGLLDLTVGRPLLDEFTVNTRSREASTIAPQLLPAIRGHVKPAVSRSIDDLSAYLIAAAVMLLLTDAARMSLRRTVKRAPTMDT